VVPEPYYSPQKSFTFKDKSDRPTWQFKFFCSPQISPITPIDIEAMILEYKKLGCPK